MDIKLRFLLVAVFNVAAGDYARYAEFVRSQADNSSFVRQFEEHLKMFADSDQALLKNEEFPCKPYPRPSGSTTTVHSLRPQDIRVVGALGDSITAGTGIQAATVIGLLKEDRGLSWSIGGDKSISEVKTIPNILKIYNPDIRGFSTGWGPVWIESSSKLNVANPGDKAEDMPGQAELIVERMKANSDIDFQNDWKLITLFVGGNDLCSYCEDKAKYSAENYVAHIQKALDHLHANVPRAFVNLVQILDIAIVKRLNANFVCDTLHLFLCDCGAFPKNSEEEADMVRETQRYRNLTAALVKTGRYDTRDDFTVVLQPFFTETQPPLKEGTDEPDLSFFAPDCFHLSLKGHRAATDALWNNMIEPVGGKRKVWTPGEEVECPSAEHPYFYTYKNSHGANQRVGKGLSSSYGDLPAAQANTPPTDQHTSTGARVAIVAGAFMLVAIATVGLVALKRRHTSSQKQHSLLQTSGGYRYSAI